MTTELELLLAENDFLKSQLELQRHRITDDVRRALDIEYTRQNNNLEGGSLTLDETEILIKTGLMTPGKPMMESLATLNHFQAIQFIREQAGEQALLTETLIKQLHAVLARAVDRQGAGVYRTQASAISANPLLPGVADLPALIDAALHWLRLEGPFMHPIAHAAEVHLRLYTLQPFSSFNGSCARLAMNLVLLEEGYPMMNIRGDDVSRQLYLRTLEQALRGGDKSAWLGFVVGQVMADSKALLKRLESVTDDI